MINIEMKHYLLFAPLTGALIMISVFAMAFSTQPPPNQTGAPNENHCATACHGNTLNSGSADLDFSLDGGSYIPDSVYTVTFGIADSSRPRFGFQMTALDANNNKAGNFTPGSQSSVQTGLGRQYINHLNATGTNSWQFTWKAPGANVGPISFYLAANASNGQGNISGDDIYTRVFVVNPDSTLTGIKDQLYPDKFFSIYPNPAKEKINVSFSDFHSFPGRIDIYNFQGKQVGKIFEGDIPANASLKYYFPQSWEAGIYFIQVEWAGWSQSQKLVLY